MINNLKDFREDNGQVSFLSHVLLEKDELSLLTFLLIILITIMLTVTMRLPSVQSLKVLLWDNRLAESSRRPSWEKAGRDLQPQNI